MITKIPISITPMTILSLWFLLVITLHLYSSYGSFNVGCQQSERESLLKFKHDLEDPSNRLASWADNGDCCSWSGIVCDNSTSHVLELHLGTSLQDKESMFRGKINPSLANLKHLRYLDLSYNDFGGIPIPTFLGSMGSLRYLKLSRARFGGKIPHQLGNLSSLVHLNLENDDDYKLHVENLHWLSSLCNLRELYLDGTNLRQEINDFFENQLGCASEGIEFLGLSNCQLFGNLITNHLGKFQNLTYLDLTGNLISGSIPMSLGELAFLRYLYLDNNKLNETLLFNFGKLQKLERLSISNNSIPGPFPTLLRGLASLQHLDLSHNKLNGTLPFSFGGLEQLEFADISYNYLEGEVLEIHFRNLTNLGYFEASGNQLKWNVSPNWIPPLQLSMLKLRSWLIGPQFPTWLQSLTSLVELDLSNSGISDSIPIWFWNFSSQFEYLNLSHNQICGAIPNTIEVTFALVDLSFNRLTGPLPSFSSRVFILDLSNNSFSGSMSNFLCHKMNEEKQMSILIIGNNLLSGNIPNCWTSWKHLEAIYLSNNKFTGNIPRSIGYLSLLRSLHLRNNKLSGELPLSLKNCTKLVVLDIGGNELVGNIPTWIGESFSNMLILILRSNNFHGHMPKGLCQLDSLQVLDLAQNRISGTIPSCINNFRAMAARNNSLGDILLSPYAMGVILENELLVMKGQEGEYGSILKLVRTVDLSKNKLSGGIPEEVTALRALQSLNLSQNLLTGRIPENIGAMRDLESLDLSLNQISGAIPQSMAGLTFLSHLNLSNNELSGRIPLGTQLQGFQASSFGGNKLCGPPLKNCSGDGTPNSENGGQEEDHKGWRMNWFYVSMIFGFVIGFWGVVGPLLFNRRWRLAYFSFLDNLGYEILEKFQR